MGVVGALELAISLRRDDGFGSRFSDPVAQVVGIITLVGDRGADLEAVDKFMCEGNVVTLAGAGDQTDRIAERIAGGMDLGTQPAARPAQALGIRPPFDWRAPASDFWRSVMDCDALRDDQWERIRGFVPGGTKGKRGPRTDNRRFLNALLWMARSGGRWRDLPERLGDYRSVKPLDRDGRSRRHSGRALARS